MAHTWSARYGALPVVWCIAGEGDMPYYLSKDKEKDKALQRTGWTEVATYVRQLDPFHRLVTIHPVQSGAADRSKTQACSISTCFKPATAIEPVSVPR